MSIYTANKKHLMLYIMIGEKYKTGGVYLLISNSKIIRLPYTFKAYPKH